MNKIIFYIFISLLISCKPKVKSINEKLEGNWKRELINGMGGKIVGVDTITFTQESFIKAKDIYYYYIKENYIIFQKNNDTNSYCFEFKTDQNMVWKCFTSPGYYFNLIKF
jgi:hypothetical protein